MKITRDEIARNNGYRDNHETVLNNVALNSMKSLVTVPYRSMNENEKLILMVVSQAGKPLSRAEICRKIKRKKAPGIVKLIENLVEAGHLIRHQQTRANGVLMFTYSGHRLDIYGNPFPSWLD